jgi:Tfp pilus assembly protein PilF
MAKSETDKQVDRLEQLLDVGLAALKGGDDQAALLALQEALKAADSLPKKKQP